MAFLSFANSVVDYFAKDKFRRAESDSDKTIGFISKFIWETGCLYVDVGVASVATMKISSDTIEPIIQVMRSSQNMAWLGVSIGLNYRVIEMGRKVARGGMILMPPIALGRCVYHTFIKKDINIL